jgi:hypothetical protein
MTAFFISSADHWIVLPLLYSSSIDIEIPPIIRDDIKGRKKRAIPMTIYFENMI